MVQQIVVGLTLAILVVGYTEAAERNPCEEFPELADCGRLALQKRKSAYMRFGKRAAPFSEFEDAEIQPFAEYEKRKSAYMRFGKRSAPSMEEAPAAPSTEDFGQMEKRKSAYMRFGKRKSAYMRFGKRSDQENEIEGQMEKRKVAALRFG